MKVQISHEEIVDEQRRVIGELQHELLVQGIALRKMQAELEKYEEASPEKNAEALDMAPSPVRRRLAIPQETYPVPQTPDELATAP